MSMSAAFEPPDLVVATLSGVVTSGDQTRLVTSVQQWVREAGSVRMLVRLDTFAGWNPRAEQGTETPWLGDEGISKMAIVGDAEWRIQVLTLITQPLRRMPIKYFDTESVARQWLGRGSDRGEGL
jgi:SpoIIAA-like